MHKIQIRVHKTAKADKQGSLWWSDWSVGRFISVGWASVIAGAGWRMGAVQWGGGYTEKDRRKIGLVIASH